jgi:hypothetical protein
MVFMGDGRAKERHDAIAQHLIHRALEAVHGAHHAVEGGGQQPLGSFRIEATDELRRTHEVGEEYCDLLAFALQRTHSGAELLGKVRRNGGEWRTRGRWRSNWLCCRGGISGPDQDFALIINGQLFGLMISSLRASRCSSSSANRTLSAR